MKKTLFIIIVLIVGLIMLSGCASPNMVENVPDAEGNIAGFWWGLWNGMTVFFSFIGSLFDKDIAIYAVNNNGGWYDFGFFLGIGGLGGVASSATSNHNYSS